MILWLYLFTTSAQTRFSVSDFACSACILITASDAEIPTDSASCIANLSGVGSIPFTIFDKNDADTPSSFAASLSDVIPFFFLYWSTSVLVYMVSPLSAHSLIVESVFHVANSYQPPR